MVLIIGQFYDDFLKTIGKAILTYAKVEEHHAYLLGALLETNDFRTNLIFHTVQNIRGRNGMIDALLWKLAGQTYKKHWDSISTRLQVLAKFRNAIAHWHPVNILYVGPSKKSAETGLRNPTPGMEMRSIRLDDIPPFMEDCEYLIGVLGEFEDHIRRVVRGEHGPWPEKFLKPITRQNLAVLQRHQRTKAQQPRPRP